MTTLNEFRSLLESPEDRQVEFKSASSGFHFEELIKYCVALKDCPLVSGWSKTQINAMKTQFQRNSGADPLQIS
jgi:hypothetical protein